MKSIMSGERFLSASLPPRNRASPTLFFYSEGIPFDNEKEIPLSSRPFPCLKKNAFFSTREYVLARDRTLFQDNGFFMNPPDRPDLSPVVFRMQAVTKVYAVGEVEVKALKGVDLDLFEGEFAVLLGPSDSGKSPLLNILGGLDVPSQGKVFYRDQDLTLADADELTRFRRNHVGFVFQFYNLIPSLTALENVTLVAEIAEDPM
jgi:ABC-type glutathione transport system ATPase component